MRQFKVINDQLLDMGVEVNRIGKWKGNNSSSFLNLNRKESFIFPFTSTSHSLGDWGIISRLPECIKKIYPNSKVYVPSPLLIKEIFNVFFQQGMWSSFIKSPWEVSQIILKNNPFIDGTYEKNQLKGECFTDHYRLFSNMGDDNEPLIEQMLRAFGASDIEIKNIDSKPKIYISDEEKEWFENFISKYFGLEYGCLLLSSSKSFLNKQWEFDYNLFPHIEKYRNFPVFYYSSFDVNKTEWGSKFKEFIAFDKLNLSFREQLIIKQKAKFNIGYQAGITDAISGGGSDIITLTPYDNINKNIIRGVKYVFKDGNTKIY